MKKELPTRSRSIAELKLSGIIRHFGKKQEDGSLNPLIREYEGKRISIFGLSASMFIKDKHIEESVAIKFVVFEDSPELLDILSTKNYGDFIRIRAVLNKGTGWRDGKFNRVPEWEVVEITYGKQKIMPQEILMKIKERAEKKALEKKGIDYESLNF